LQRLAGAAEMQMVAYLQKSSRSSRLAGIAGTAELQRVKVEYIFRG
jgi:hypothetical protein